MSGNWLRTTQSMGDDEIVKLEMMAKKTKKWKKKLKLKIINYL
jgi:hypothetical protein